MLYVRVKLSWRNREQRPRFGDPRSTATNWRGVLRSSEERIDGVVHIRSWNNLEGPTFFFKGKYLAAGLEPSQKAAKRWVGGAMLLHVGIQRFASACWLEQW